MKKLSEIKQEVAIKHGCESWSDLLNTYHKGDHESFYDEVTKLYANEKIQLVADNLDWGNCYDGGCHCGREKHEQQILSHKD